MLTFSCPHCGTSLAHIRSLAGKSTLCPHCHNQFVMPESENSAGALVPTSVHPPAEVHPRQRYMPAPQPTIIVTGSQEPRLEAGGWFTRAFSTTSGVIVAMLLFAALIVGVPIFVTCGGCVLLMRGVSDAVAKAEKRAEKERLTNSPRPVGASLDSDVEVNQLSEAWQPFDQPLAANDVLVRISAVQRGRVQLTDILDEPAQSEREFLQIRVSIENNSEIKKLDFHAWNDPAAFLSRNIATLEDDLGNNYKRVEFPLGTKVEGRQFRQTIYPGRDGEASLVFELPVDAATVLRLKMSAEAVGAQGEFRFEIPTSVLTPSAFSTASPKRTETHEVPVVQTPTEPSPPAEREFHTWTTADGKFSTEAQFLSLTAGVVKLKKRDGSIAEVPLEKLSDEDQRYIRSGAYKRAE